MPICGFNKKMANGLERFLEGLAEHSKQFQSPTKEEIMAVCGFNKKMAEGLSGLLEGLAEHGLTERTAETGETIDQGIKREISDMARLMPELVRIDDVAKRTLTEGVVKMAVGFYLIMRRENLEKKSIDGYQDVVKKIIDYCWAMDEKYYSELEGRPDDMKELAEFLNTVEI